MADARNILVPRLGRYKLCKYCLHRHGSRQKPSGPCHICRGLMLEKDSIVGKMVGAAREFQYDTFLIGAVLPMQVYEREDALRARLKIRGMESVKSQLTRELGIQFSSATGKKVDYLDPDLVMNLAIDKENNVGLSIRSRPVIFFGRYRKKAPGFAQKQDKCTHCEGKGCKDCGQTGLSGFDSIEGLLAKELVRRTGGRTPKFSWLGSEDRSSRVLGDGRPFYVRVYDPKRRRFKSMAIRGDSISARLMPAKETAPQQSAFVVKTKIQIRCDRPVQRDELKKLDSLSNSEVRFESRSRIATKMIYSAATRRIDDSSFSLTIVADGGLMIKQFVGGEEYMKPNVSETLGCKCDCITFDILDVRLQEKQAR